MVSIVLDTICEIQYVLGWELREQGTLLDDFVSCDSFWETI